MGIGRGVGIQYLGHSTFLFTSPSGRKVLIDPWTENNPACPKEAAQIDSLDVILVTHGHFDHIQDAVSLATRLEPQVVCIFEIANWLESKGVSNIVAMNKGGTVTVEGLRVTMVDARHSSGIMADDGTMIEGGEPAGYVVEFENGLRIYFAGDTCVFGDMKIIAEIYQPELIFLPIGDHFTMGPVEAAYACRLLDARKVIPMHYGTFPILTGTPDELARLTRDLGTEVIAMSPGETL
ncbi:MAG: metal-dependent hydrolase [Acidobacteriota bacterium]|nr:metal-dependent hydrolase [Acidobacteriota bacterium]